MKVKLIYHRYGIENEEKFPSVKAAISFAHRHEQLGNIYAFEVRSLDDKIILDMEALRLKLGKLPPY
jgi:hypothetical protein